MRGYVTTSEWTTICFTKWINLDVHLRSYNGHDLKGYLRISNVDPQLNIWDIAMLSLHAITRHDPDAPMKIERARLKHHNSPLHIASQMLILLKIRSNNHAQFQNIINSLFDEKCIRRCFKLSKCLDISILESLDFFLLDSFMCLGSAWNQDFVKRIGRNRLLNAKIYLQNHIMKSPWSNDQLYHFKRNFRLDYVFSS